jgi:hypothetical protein
MLNALARPPRAPHDRRRRCMPQPGPSSSFFSGIAGSRTRRRRTARGGLIGAGGGDACRFPTALARWDAGRGVAAVSCPTLSCRCSFSVSIDPASACVLSAACALAVPRPVPRVC